MAKKAVVVIAEDEEPILNAYEQFARHAGFNVRRFSKDTPFDIKNVGNNDALIFPSFKMADTALGQLGRSHEHLIAALISDQVLEPGAQDYFSHGGPFGTTLMTKHAETLKKHRSTIGLRTAENGSITPLFESVFEEGLDLKYIHKGTDTKYSGFIDLLAQGRARTGGIRPDETCEKLKRLVDDGTLSTPSNHDASSPPVTPVSPNTPQLGDEVRAMVDKGVAKPDIFRRE